MIRVPKISEWRPGRVDRTKPHFELRYGSANDDGWEKWVPVALVGAPKAGIVSVQFLISKGSREKAKILESATGEVQYYLIDLKEDDPWGYAQYHCGTASNLSSDVHWSFFKCQESTRPDKKTIKQPHCVARYCVYTIVDGKQLDRLAQKERKHSFRERKRWVTGEKLWQRSRDNGEVVPVLFGDATSCSHLKHWGFLTRVSVDDDGTTYTVDRLRKLDGHKTQELRLLKTGKNCQGRSKSRPLGRSKREPVEDREGVFRGRRGAGA